MSNLDTTPTLTNCGGRAGVPAGPVTEIFAGKQVSLGEKSGVTRLLPNLGRRLVGPWCFVDHYGPDDIATEPGMTVPPHPHIGLQTVSWLLEGEVRHQDHHCTDIVPTILEACGVPMPEVIDGVTQAPLAGVSMVYSFDEAGAPTTKETQYFEMLGTRGI